MLTSVFVQPLATDSKTSWRRWAKETRSQLASQTLDYEVMKTLRNSELYQEATHILTYLAFGSEIDLTGLHQEGIHQKNSKHFYVTRIWDNGDVSVHSLTRDLEKHPYGFLQPLQTAPSVASSKLELVLVPGLAFDHHGTRLGYGKGYYDRLLADLPKVARIGISAEALLVEILPKTDFDVPMTHLVTEKKLYNL
ncbi:MAG: 5-formyltetrahydrofolate cyclo-ligase [Trueperaceae bacterium]